MELELETAKGNQVWARAIGNVEKVDQKPVRLFGVFQDITDIKSFENALRDLNEELAALLNSGQVAIISTDPQGIIRHFNKGAGILLGYRTEEVVGKMTPEVFYLESELNGKAETLREELNKEVEGFARLTENVNRGKQDAQEWTLRRKDGSTFPAQQALTHIKDHKDQMIGYLFVVVDITLLKETQKRTDSLLEISSEQNARLRNFAHIVSHNLRSHSANISMILD